MAEITASDLQTCVVGCGECGSRIAATFDKTPSFLKHRAMHLYPFRCASVDTDKSIPISLPKDWDWRELEDIHIMPLASPETVYRRILKKPADVASPFYKRYAERAKSGAGGFPYIGTLTAEEYLLKDTPEGKDLQERFVKRGFTKGALLVVNSLTGGTGTGFAPAIPEFLSPVLPAGIILNLSIIPQVKEPHITLLEEEKQAYPGSIIYGLSKLSRSKRVDAVILADNYVLSYDYKCKGYSDYNGLLHEILASILLAPLGEYGCPNFCSTLDFADIQRTLRPLRGLGLPELCALATATKKPPWEICLRFMGSKRRGLYVNKWLQRLVDSAISKNTVGKVSERSTFNEIFLKDIKGAVAVLSGPPQFFDRVLEGQQEYFYNLEAYAKERISSNLRLAFLHFPEMKEVRLSLILSGVTSPQLENVYRAVVPPSEQRKEGTLMDRIRQLTPKTVDDLMTKEIREQLAKETPLEAEEEGAV